MRPRPGELDPAQGLGVCGRALLQTVAVHRVHPLPAQGRVLPEPGQRSDLLRRQSAPADLRQPQGGRAQRLGTQCLLPSRVPGAVRLFLCAAGRLRAAGSGIERGGGRGRALRQAQRPGGPGRRADPLRGLPGPGALLARSGGQPAPTRDHPRATARSLPAGAGAAAAAARPPLRHRRNRAGRRQSACPHRLRRQSLFRAAAVRAPTAHPARQPGGAAPAARRPGGGATRPQLPARAVAGAAGAPPGSADAPPAPVSTGAGASLRRLGAGGTRVPSGAEQPPGEDQRARAPLAEPGPTLRPDRGAGRHHPGCAVLIGPTGTGKTHLLTALGYTVCERGYSVCYTRVVDMLNHLTTAQINGRLAKALKTYVRPQVLLLDELGYLPIDKRGADLLFQVVAARYESGSIVLTTNRTFREWGTLFDVDNTP